MPYVFRETQVGEPINASEFPSLTSEVLTETFAQTFEENPIAALARSKELADDYRSGQRLDAATAKQRLTDRGMESDIKINDAGITQDALDTLMFRKGIEKRRQEIYAQAEGGFAQGAARLGVGLATSLVDPISVATAFIPVVGEARYLGWLGRAGGVIGRTGVRAGVGAIEGAAGAALLEPIIAGSRRYEQADYGMADSLLNVAFGGLFGTGLHSVGGAISDGVNHYRSADPVWRGLESVSPAEIPLVQNLRQEIASGMDARDIARVTETWSTEARLAVQVDARAVSPAEAAHQSLPPQARENVLKQAIIQAVTGDPVNVQPIVQRAMTRQTETPEFKGWFADSVVADDAGSPRVVYHATDTDFGDFDFSRLGESTRANTDQQAAIVMAEVGAWASSEKLSNALARSMDKPLYMSIRNPMRTTFDELWEMASGFENGKSFRSHLEKEGYDGLILQDTELGGTSYVALRPEQIKAAIADNGPSSGPGGGVGAEVTNVSESVKYAENVLARETDTGTPTADALKMATEEASLAQSDLKAVADRLGLEVEDAELRNVLEAANSSERWAKAAELATICLTRGG